MSLPSSYYDSQDVKQWLEDLFQGEEIPDFDESEELMEILMKVMAKNKEAEKDVTEIIKIEQNSTEFYKQKSEELKSLLDGENLSLSSETLERVESIAALANKMNLKEPTLTNFLLAINEAEIKDMENKEKGMILDYQMLSLSRKTTKIMKTNEMLRRDLKNLEKKVKVQETKKPMVVNRIPFVDRKITEYTYAIKKYKSNLESREYDPSLQHHQLIQRSESIKDLAKKVQSLQSKLDSYRSLPPNESLARLKVQEGKNELSALQEEFQRLLESASGTSYAETSADLSR